MKTRYFQLLIPVLLFMSGVTRAQTAMTAGSEAQHQVEEVVVIGSRIKRQDFTSISPLVTLDAEQVTLSGITALEDLVNDAPQLVPYLDRSSNNPGTGVASLNLRGLGPNRTLVTLNGRRMAPADEFGAADINIIPARLIERVQVVTGGASTVYGSDAVAGVVDFVLNDRFEGLEVTGQYDTFEEGDGDVTDLSVVFGFGNERSHVTGFLNVQDREPVFAGDRVLTEIRLQESFTPGSVGELQPSGSPTTPQGTIVFPPAIVPGTGAPPSQITFSGEGTPRPVNPVIDQYNFQPDNYLQVPLERTAAALFGSFELTDTTRLFAEVLFADTSSTLQLAPPPAFVEAVVNLDNPLLTDSQRGFFGSAYDPDGNGLAEFIFSRRLVETGPRILERDAETLRLILGVEGELGANWDWDATVGVSDVQGDNITGNSVFAGRFNQGLLVDPATGACVDEANGCVPFNPFGLSIPPEAAEFLRTGDLISTYSVDENLVSVNVTGDAITLPAGAVGVAAGVEWRELSSRNDPAPELISVGVLGFGGAAQVRGTTDVAEVYAEVLVPILSAAPFADYLAVEAGYRYSDYKFSGAVDNWKVGVDWSPTPSVRFRAMLQQAVRAPNIDELFAQASERPGMLFSPGEDFCAASADPVARGLTDLCVAQGIPADQVGVYQPTIDIGLVVFEGGGNTSLNPETAETLTAGVVVQPERIPHLSLSLDYYRIEIDNAIGSTSLTSALDLCARSNDPASQFCSPVVRDATGNIREYTNPQFNLAALAVEGVDLAVNYRFDLSDSLALFGNSASINVQMLANFAMENTVKSTPTGNPLDCAGFYGGACSFGIDLFQVVPEYRSSTRLTYESGPLTVGLNWQWIGDIDLHLDITCRDFSQFCYPSELDQISDRSYIELSGWFEIGEHAEIFGGVSNLFEEEAPLMGFGATQSNTAPQLYDVYGRRFFVGARYRL